MTAGTQMNIATDIRTLVKGDTVQVINDTIGADQTAPIEG